MNKRAIRFEVQRFGLGATSLEDVKSFALEHKDSRGGLVVTVDPTGGVGTCFADLLEAEGFTVDRRRASEN